MCGIAGFCGEGDRSALEAMLAAVAHRGPDGHGSWVDPALPVFLGHHRLAIIDLQGGQQPMATPDGQLVVTYNGEIYNHLELRRDLERLGHRFLTDHSDTEVLLYAYRQWGREMVERLNGMWAFALFDHSQRTLFLSRDRFGEKPLFYTNQPGLFAFASELKALTRHPMVHATVSQTSVQKYFAYGYIPSPLTIYRSIHKLPAGVSLTYALDDESAKTSKYWDLVLEPFQDIPKSAELEWGDELVVLLRRSVRRRLMADVDLGVFLSGGIDSSTIAALASQESSSPIQTFTVGFEEPSFDESRPAEAVARAIGSKHQLQMMSLEQSVDHLPKIVAMLDEPIGDPSLLPTWLVSGMARNEVKVALSGDGGDELFAGYDPFAALTRAAVYSRSVPTPVHKAISLLAGLLPVSHGNMSLDFKVKRFLSGLTHPSPLWVPVWMAPLSPSDLNQLFGTELDMEDVYSEAIATWDDCSQDNLVDRVSQFYVKLYLQDDILAKTDRASMMHGLEVRAPFLDIEVVDFVRRIPWQFKYRRGQRKYLLKRAVAGLIPSATIQRPKKGFGVPVGQWFRQGKLTVDSGRGAALNRGFIEQCIASHLRGGVDHRLFLWSYWVLTEMNLASRRD